MTIRFSGGQIIGNGNLTNAEGGKCCCCVNCCHKFCGDETLENGLAYDSFGISGDANYQIVPGSVSLTINNQPKTGEGGFCGILFEFTTKVNDFVSGTECLAPSKMWLCSADHRSEGYEGCFCTCHWHIEIEECDSGLDFCEGQTECEWEWDGNQWVKQLDCDGDCGCPDPDAAGEQIGDLATTFCSPNDFPAMDFWGGDDCLNAACDAPNCGDCKNFGNAWINVVDPDGSVRCCCLEAYDTGEI